MFARMNSGLQDAQTGLAVNGCQLSVLTSGIVKRRRTEKGIQADEVLRLGPAFSEYTLARAGDEGMEAALRICQFTLSSAESLQLRWPAAPGDVKAFADSVLAWSQRVRSMSHNGFGLNGGRSNKYSYKAKSFTRAVLLLVEARMPRALHDFTFGEVLAHVHKLVMCLLENWGVVSGVHVAYSLFLSLIHI